MDVASLVLLESSLEPIGAKQQVLRTEAVADEWALADELRRRIPRLGPPASARERLRPQQTAILDLLILPRHECPRCGS